MNELSMYNIDCENIETIMNKLNKLEEKEDKNKNNNEVSVNNDKKYRDLRTIIMKQRNEIDDLKSQVKILETLVSK